MRKTLFGFPTVSCRQRHARATRVNPQATRAQGLVGIVPYLRGGLQPATERPREGALGAAGLMVRIRTWFVVVAVAALVVGRPIAQTSSYRVGPKDVLAIAVFGHPELSGKLTVAADGTIAFPLLGPINAGQRTSAEIAEDLVARLSDGFLKKPQVSVDVVEYLSQRIFVIGEVRTPGLLPLTGSTTLLEALSRAGSLTEQAGGEVLVLRPLLAQAASPVVPGQVGVTELGRVGVQQLRSGTLPANIELRDGDTIFVPRAAVVHVLGNVKSPGAYRFEVGLTAIRAIYLAGGVSELGTTGRIEITRLIDGRETQLKAKPDDVLKPDDTVIVGTRRF
jgi:polysaccharide biosynthesis/export protein